ncbi:SSU ribosomal protein S6P [Tepidamorphus gemmatus]|uniref:Small ribosomal subunit protein bS6 n=1 Tax=Tepidamorphus gemmatus TaxID=747076 RepID=A0A4R3MCF7_9HYPH|nr:30S ribosomal protein S6 [Tepidamorphus gemmatus]TCT11384.1 SSU ribosomal protein S6P [Tepidamorphus gemmatus]
MPLYEHVFLARQDMSAQQVEALTEQLKSILEQGGGKVAKTEYWGVRPLTFRIKKNRKAHYSLLNIDAPHSAVAEMERQMSLSDDILRFMTVRVEEHEEGPSAILARRDRDDRGERRGDRGDRPGGFRSDRGDRGDRGDRRPSRFRDEAGREGGIEP